MQQNCNQLSIKPNLFNGHVAPLVEMTNAWQDGRVFKYEGSTCTFLLPTTRKTPLSNNGSRFKKWAKTLQSSPTHYGLIISTCYT